MPSGQRSALADGAADPVCRSCGAGLEPGDRYCPQCGRSQDGSLGSSYRRLESVARNVQDLLYGVLGWTFVLLALAPLLLAANSVAEGSVAGLVAGLVLAVFCLGFGVVLNPRFGRQIARRHDPATLGRTRTVDHRVIRPEERCLEPCVVCGQGFDVGLVRRRRDETVLAGLPVRTHEIAHNHYCADCAEDEVFGSDVDRGAVDAEAFSEAVTVDELDDADEVGREDAEPERAE